MSCCVKNKTMKKEPISKIKIALLSSSTITGIKDVLSAECKKLGVTSEIFIGGYNQYNQEILDGNSKFYSFKPNLVVLFVDTRSLLGDTFFHYYQLLEKEKNNLFENFTQQIKLLADKISRNLNCKVILHNFEVPVNSPMGIIDGKQKLGFVEFVKNINYEINKYYKENDKVFVFDYDLFCSKYGKENILDYKMYYLGDIKINFKYLPQLCKEYIAYIKPLLSLTKKCIVLDLDNTVWGGVVGEDGLSGIKLGPTPEGKPFLEFQKHILSLFQRGVILAINSKNNPKDALEVLRKHPHMVLKEKHFASVKINWENKISNMKAIAQELNIGLNSMVFFDDDKANREMVRTALPEVKVVDLPEDSSLYSKTLLDLNEFNSFNFSEEDRKKGQMYAEQRKRQEFLKTTEDTTKYLKALNMIVTIEKPSSFNIPRISQLTQKTNQFNTTTKRYFEEDIKRFSNGGNYLISAVAVADKFGDNGLTGVAIVKKDKKIWEIDTFLLSCRVMGRNMEDVMLAHIVEEAKKEKVKTLVGVFVPTKKNMPAEDFFKKSGFSIVLNKKNVKKWEFSADKGFAYPKFIKVEKKWRN